SVPQPCDGSSAFGADGGRWPAFARGDRDLGGRDRFPGRNRAHGGIAPEFDGPSAARARARPFRTDAAVVTILCLDIEPETLALLQRQRRPPALREADSPAHLIAALEHDPTATEAVLLGRGVDDPLRLVHYAHALDPDLS